MKTPLLLSLPLALFAACGSSANGAAITEITNLGSDTMLEVAGAFSQAYHDVNPNIEVSVSGGGSGVGIASLIDGDVDIANCSRPLKQNEIDLAKKNGQSPVQHIVGYDGIAIYVHKDNPIESLTIAQLKEIYGDGGKIESWKDLGIDMGSDDANNIVLGSRQNNSGTYECFREHVLGDNGRFKTRCNNLNGSKDVVDFCAKTKSAIGYSGIAYATDDVRIVPVKRDDASPAVTPSNATVLDKSYAIARPLFMYTNGEPQGEIKTYLEWIKGDAGQAVLKQKGYVPLKL